VIRPEWATSVGMATVRPHELCKNFPNRRGALVLVERYSNAVLVHSDEAAHDPSGIKTPNEPTCALKLGGLVSDFPSEGCPDNIGNFNDGNNG